MSAPINLLEMIRYDKDFLDDYHYLVTQTSGGPNPLSGEDDTIELWVEFKSSAIELLKKTYSAHVERLELSVNQKLGFPDIDSIDWETTCFIFQSKWLNELVVQHYKEATEIFDPWA